MTYPKDFPYLDDEEREIMESVDRGEWVEVPEEEVQAVFARLEKNSQKSTVTVSKYDLEQVSNKAKSMGISRKKAISLLFQQFGQGKINLEL